MESSLTRDMKMVITFAMISAVASITVASLMAISTDSLQNALAQGPTPQAPLPSGDGNQTQRHNQTNVTGNVISPGSGQHNSTERDQRNDHP